MGKRVERDLLGKVGTQSKDVVKLGVQVPALLRLSKHKYFILAEDRHRPFNHVLEENKVDGHASGRNAQDLTQIEEPDVVLLVHIVHVEILGFGVIISLAHN